MTDPLKVLPWNPHMVTPRCHTTEQWCKWGSAQSAHTDAKHHRVSTSLQRMHYLLFLFALQPWRLCLGEAQHPGPQTCEIYCANVTGVGNKAPLFDSKLPAVWCLQETHLTTYGQKAFMRNLNYRAKTLGTTPWKAAWGHPCPSRAGGISGGTATGTAILAKQPIRDMTHFLPEPQRLTSRCAVATTRLGTMWMVMASAYGYAKGANHQDHLEDTDWLLLPMAELLLTYTNRPALLAGDLNHSISELQSIQLLLNAGWIDIQDWNARNTGQAPNPTCKGTQGWTLC